MDKRDIDKVLASVIREAKAAGIPISNKIEEHVYVNPRPRRRFGCCKTVGGVFVIEISEFLLDADDMAIRSVVAHEVLHTAKKSFKHSDTWKEYAEIMNKKYGYNIKTTSKFEEMGLPEKSPLGRKKYIIKCKSCGKEFPRIRMGAVAKNIDNYKCKCGGKLEIVDPH